MYYGKRVAPEETDTDRAAKKPPPAGWMLGDGPAEMQRPAVALVGMQLRYRPDLPMVLKGVSWSAPHGAKVGIVGRTGSGKSSTIMALTQLYKHEAAAAGQGGGGGAAIQLDGVDIAGLPLAVLRDSIALIPQEPSLFSGEQVISLHRSSSKQGAHPHDISKTPRHGQVQP